MVEEREFQGNEAEALSYFLSLKKTYKDQRQSWEYNWDQALVAVYLTPQTNSEKLDKLYNGLSRIQSPIMNWKVNGILARINKIIFNVDPIGRIEDTLVAGPSQRNFVDLWNAYIFDYQLNQIDFAQAYKQFQKNKIIQGTAFAKITQEFEEKEVDFFDDLEEAETVTVKDNTFFRNLLIEEFYSDVNKEDINESQACIHSTNVTMEFLLKNEKRTVTNVFEVVDEFGNVSKEVEEEEIGSYHNLDLIQPLLGKNITPEQEDYIEWLGLSATDSASFKEALQETNKTGFVHLDECYGKFSLDGETVEEVICTIANGTVVVQLEKTPFKHKRYVRPFIRGVYKPIPNCLYGESNVVLGLNLLQELNASRAQAADAKTFSIFPMTYIDKSKFTINRWDKQWRPMGIIEGTGPSGITPIAQPYLGNIAINDSLLIQRDLDQLWSLSPVQEGTSDSRLIPNTAQATRQIISQNDMPLNDIINNSINNELKPFIEMLYERNLAFKSVDDLKTVWTSQQIASAGLISQEIELDGGSQEILLDQEGNQVTMRDFLFDVDIKILGNLELSNEIAHQQGWIAFGRDAQQIPSLAKRVDWQVYGEKLLEAYGIKDDAEGLFHDPEVILEIDQEQSQANQQALQSQAQQQEQLRTQQKEDYVFKVETDTEAKIVENQAKTIAKVAEDQAEVEMELRTGQKVM